MVAIVHNGTSDIASLEVAFAAYDASGEVLAQESTSAPIARADATVATAMPLEIKQGKVASVSAEVNVLQKQHDDHPESKLSRAASGTARASSTRRSRGRSRATTATT
jgi:hypothetical protein